jgi:CBS domain-containing protein
MLGTALGGLLGAVLPGAGEGTWALIGMAAAMAGVMRSPFTSIVFALELTHDVNALLALLLACTIAHLVSVLTLKRSILTEKIARRGYHVTREYEIDPLHALLVRDVMSTEMLTVEPSLRAATLYERLSEGSDERRQRLYPVLDSDERLAGVLAFSDVLAAHQSASPLLASELARQPIFAFADETLREAADRMLACGHGVLPVTDRANPHRLVGLVGQFDLLRAHERVLIEERHRERPLGPRRLTGGLGTLIPARELRS